MSSSPLPAQEKLSPLPSGAFSIVLIPDTQAYKGAGVKGGDPQDRSPLTNPIFKAHVDWIANNITSQNIAFVSHVGDIVDKNEDGQWKVARDCMDVIHGKVPYGISVGNHDMTSKGDATLFQKYFPASRYREFPWYGGSYSGSPMGPHVSGNNANSFQLFEVGGRKFVFLHLECNAPDDVVAWANEILKQHSDRNALITCHMGWGPRAHPTNDDEYITGEKGRMEWSKIHDTRGNTPAQLWEKCYRHHPNLLAVFSGDQSRSVAIKASTPADDGHPIHELMQDYGSGWLRVYRCFPSENRVEAVTFNPTTEILCETNKLVPDRAQHQFELPVKFLP